MERELRRSERLAAVGELSASIAHEIRNPLAAISGSIQLLGSAAAPRGSREAARLREIVLRETDRLNLLITDFLRYARPGPLRIEAVALRGLVAELLEMLGSVIPGGVAVRVDVPDGLAVQGDAAQLRQILWNLAINSLQAMPDGGVLSIAAAPAASQGGGVPGRNHLEEEKGGEAVDVCVRDEGSGIPPELLDRVFDPFFTTKPGGSGLGLATVHRIVEEHGGSLRVESQLGSGTAVWLRLPRAEAAT
jgi:two-component system sensor histidine kinase PilS (NtrC family)